MMIRVRLAAAWLVLLAFASPPLWGQPAKPAAPAPARAPRLTVAVLDFESSIPGSPDLGRQIGDTLTAELSGDSAFSLVERASLRQILQEHALNMTGLVSADQATTIGKLVGAKVLVTGRAFILDRSVLITAKVIATDTSLIDGVLVKGRQGGDVADLIVGLGDKIAARLRAGGIKLVAPLDTGKDPLLVLKAKLAKLKLPTLLVAVSEQHIESPRVIDPAVDTELRMLLTQAGMTVIDPTEMNADIASATVTIKGEAISEPGVRVESMISCNARVELKVVNIDDGKTLFVDRATARGVDVSEQVAAKTALQTAAHSLGIKILEHFAATLPPLHPTTGPDTAPAAAITEPAATAPTFATTAPTPIGVIILPVFAVEQPGNPGAVNPKVGNPTTPALPAEKPEP